MITLTTVAILGALLAWVSIMFFKKSEPAVPMQPRQDLANLKIGDARVGDTISIAGAGDDLTDVDFTADRQKQYEAGSKHWFELSGMYRERRVYVEVFDDEEVETRAALDGRKLTLDQLGLTEEDLAAMDERQNAADSFESEGIVWMYRASREIGEFRDRQEIGAGMYRWDFQEENGKRFLYVKKPQGEPFSAVVLQQVNPGDITVYRGG
ncbi:MAG: hypothetical protein M3Z23_17695 [Acidobacteriota bacterium]|nr:hypothetical protein [Acidobacteriota bacterium]